MGTLIVQGDARNLPLADESVHLIVTSPPYNARIAYRDYDDWLSWGEYWDGLIVPALAECYRVLVPGGRLCWNMANVVRSNAPDEARVIKAGSDHGRKPRIREPKKPQRQETVLGVDAEEWALMVAPLFWRAAGELGFLPREQVTWVKGEDQEGVTTASTAWGTWKSAQNPVLRAVGEPVFVASKLTHRREPGTSDLTTDEYKVWTRNVWFVASQRKAASGGHPAAFPVELATRCIKLYSYVGDVVLDPFCGSGTTPWAAKLTNRQGIGVELGAFYAGQATRRVSQGIMALEEARP